MLRFFRGGGVAQVVVGGIVSTIIVVFMVEFRAGRGPTANMKRQCAVEYAGACLDQKDYFAAYGLVVPRQLEGAQARKLGLRRKVLDGLTERELLVAKARSLDLGVGESTIDAELEAGRAHVSLPAAEVATLSGRLGLCRIDEGGRGCEPGSERLVRQLHVRRAPGEDFDYKLYEREIRILTNRGPREFKLMQERELLAERLRAIVRSRVRVSPAEVELVARRAVIRSAALSRDWFAKYSVDTSDAAVDRWGFDNRAQIDSAWESEKANYTEGCPLIREIVLPLSPLSLDDQRNPSRQKADEARARVTAGEDFASVARALSAGPSALLGGDVGCLSKGGYGVGGEELLKAVEGLKFGEISPVIDTPRGLHIVQVYGRLEAGRVEEFGRRHITRSMYAHFAGDEAARKFASDLIERVKAGQKLEDAVRELSEVSAKSAPPPPKAAGKPPLVGREAAALAAPDRPRFEISAPFSRVGDPLPDVDSKESIASKAFDLAKPDAVSDKPVETSRGYVVIQLKELISPDAKESEQVRAALWQQKADDAVASYVAELRRAAGSKLKVDQSFAEDKARSSDEE